MRLKRFSLKSFALFGLSLIVICILLIDFYPQLIRGIWVRYPKLDQLRHFTKVLDYSYLPFKLKTSPLPQYQLLIKDSDLDKLLTSLPQPYTFTIYSKSQQVSAPALFIDEHNQEYQVKVRIHGDLYHHWSGQKKSLRLNFDKPFNGYQALSFILPETRDFFIESLSQHRAQKLGLISLDSWFASLSINQQARGVYYVQEHWSKDVLEKHARNSDSDLFGEKDLDNQWAWPQLFHHLNAWKKYAKNPQNPQDYAAIDQLIKLASTQDLPELYLLAQSIIDIDSFTRWQAHSMLFPSYHQDDGHNMRLYLNSESGLFEFIPYDLELAQPTPDYDAHQYNQLVTTLLKVPEIKTKRDQILKEYVSSDLNLDDDLKYYDQLFKKTLPAFIQDKSKSYSNLFFLNRVIENRSKLIKQFTFIKQKLL